jgi:hypothetical protein
MYIYLLYSIFLSSPLVFKTLMDTLASYAKRSLMWIYQQILPHTGRNARYIAHLGSYIEAVHHRICTQHARRAFSELECLVCQVVLMVVIAESFAPLDARPSVIHSARG